MLAIPTGVNTNNYLNAFGVLFDMLSETVYNTKVAYAKKSAHVSILS